MENKTGNTLRERQDYLIKQLGFDYDVFRTTSCFEQGASDAFSQLNPKDAKGLIMRILQLEVFAQYEKKARDKVTSLENELNKQVIVRDTLKSQHNTAAVEVDKIQKEIESDRVLYKKVEDKLRELEPKVQLERKLQQLIANKDKFLGMDKCPTCLQCVTKEHKDEITKRFEEHINKTKTELGIKDVEILYNKTNLEGVEIQKRLFKNEGTFSQYERSKKNAEVDFDALEKNIVKMTEDMSSYKKLVIAFGRNGIPAFIIENSIPEVEAIANNLLEELEIDMRLRIEVQKELKSGELSDTLDITIVRDNNQMSYFNYSGGERFLIDLVLRVALSVLLLRRKGCNNSTIIIDEGFGSLDDTNKQKAIKLISLIGAKFGFLKIIVISHISEIQDGLGTKVAVKKCDGESSFEL